MFKILRDKFLKVKDRFGENSYDSILGLVDAVPSITGFSLFKEKLFAPVWVLHGSLLMYIYGAGNVMFQLHYARDAGDHIKNYVLISIFVQMTGICLWSWKKRPLLKSVLDMTKEIDTLAKNSSQFRRKYTKFMSLTKKIILAFYGLNYGNEILIYIKSSFIDIFAQAGTPCVGMDVSASPYREICTGVLIVQEIFNAIVAIYYESLLLLLIAHTTAMYLLLSEELTALNHITDREVRGKLTSIIYRHVLILNVVSKLKQLYSGPLGVNFLANVVCITLFFNVKLEEWRIFFQIMVYAFTIFFSYCFLGQSLINAAERFERAVYSCGWEKFGVSDRKMVYVMLMQAQQKVELLAADIVPVNLYTFAATLQFMYKFVTVMKLYA